MLHSRPSVSHDKPSFIPYCPKRPRKTSPAVHIINTFTLYIKQDIKKTIIIREEET